MSTADLKKKHQEDLKTMPKATPRNFAAWKKQRALRKRRRKIAKQSRKEARASR